MKGLIEQAVLVGCDVDNCARLLIFNRGVDRNDLDAAVLAAGWQVVKTPTEFEDTTNPEHACPEHALAPEVELDPAADWHAGMLQTLADGYAYAQGRLG